MRTSITLDDKVYEIASAYASARQTTLGAAIGELVLKAMSPPPSEETSEILTGPNGFPMFFPRGRVITLEMVKSAQEDDIDGE